MHMVTRRMVLLGAIATLAIAAVGANAKGWQSANGPLMTRWAKNVSPTNAHPEYPRPQMVRKTWVNLNGLWDYAITGKDDTAPSAYQGQILVPFPVESALSGVMKKVTDKDRLWYHRAFKAPALRDGERLLMHFGAVDWETTVTMNGKDVGTHKGGYDGFTFDITDALKAGGPQEAVVSVYDATGNGQPVGKQTLRPGGIFYTPCTGIWQTVWLEVVPAVSISDLIITPDVDSGTVHVKVVASSDAAGLKAVVAVLDGGRPNSSVTADANGTITVPVTDAKLWSPDSPFLYDLAVTLKKDGRVVDRVTSYFGMRKIAIDKDENGVSRLMLNGKFVFQSGPLDQGYWPDGIYTSPTIDALRYDIEVTKKLGFNMTRKHVKVEPEQWYYLCDKLGLLVWQDMPGAGNGNAEQRAQFEVELKRLVEGRRNHPSIIMWVVFNEGWGQYDTERVVPWVKSLDPSRLVNNASGWTDMKVGDVIDMHNYPGPGSPKPEAYRAAVLGEFGGLGLATPGHTWSKQSWGYQGMANTTALTNRYVGLYRGVYALKDDPGLCASVYTQITDVETECNGLLTYDRAVVKVDLAKASLAASGHAGPGMQLKTIVPTAKQEAINWRYTFEQPAAGWFKPEFATTTWLQGPAGFGTVGTPGAVVRTVWNTTDIWMRRDFEINGSVPRNAVLTLHHDDDAEIYVNGVLASKLMGYFGDYSEVEMTPEARRALRVGKNVLAVHCHQNSGGQFIDVGLAELK